MLGILYESLIHPFTILSTLPSAGVGAILALLITGTDLSVMAMIGIILLIGIVKKNAIMMIDFALQAERDAGHVAGRSHLSGLPDAFPADHDDDDGGDVWRVAAGNRNGAGSELRKPLGITIVGGLMVSQMLTLFTTPVVYLFFDRLQWKGRGGAETGQGGCGRGCGGGLTGALITLWANEMIWLQVRRQNPELTQFLCGRERPPA